MNTIIRASLDMNEAQLLVAQKLIGPCLLLSLLDVAIFKVFLLFS